jgi:hypothetical protein
MAEHIIILGSCIQLQDTTFLSTKPRYMDQMIRETIRIEIHPNSMNMEDGLATTGHGSPSSTVSKDVGSISCSIASPQSPPGN